MKKEDYVATNELNNPKIDIGNDDYSQQYFFEFINEDGEKESLGCGAYNLNFLDEVIFTIDRKGYYENKYDYDKIYEQLNL